MSDPTLLLASGLVVAVVFALCGVYGLSGAGHIRRPTLLRVGLLAIGGLCTLNGLTFVVQLLAVLNLVPFATAYPAFIAAGHARFPAHRRALSVR